MATRGHYITMLLANCVTSLIFFPPVSTMKDAMESICRHSYVSQVS